MSLWARTFSRSLLRCCVSPVRSTCWDRVTSNLQNCGFWIKSSSEIWLRANADKTDTQRERLVYIQHTISIMQKHHWGGKKNTSVFIKVQFETKKSKRSSNLVDVKCLLYRETRQTLNLFCETSLTSDKSYHIMKKHALKYINVIDIWFNFIRGKIFYIHHNNSVTYPDVLHLLTAQLRLERNNYIEIFVITVELLIIMIKESRAVTLLTSSLRFIFPPGQLMIYCACASDWFTACNDVVWTLRLNQSGSATDTIYQIKVSCYKWRSEWNADRPMCCHF